MLARMYRPNSSFMGRDMDALFEDFFRGFPASNGAPNGSEGRYPALNIWEDDSGFHLEAELPGMKLEEIELTVMGNELTIKGERKAAEREGAAFHRQERGSGAFSRLVRFPVELDAEKAQARLENGILTLDLPKHECARPRKIPVKVSNGK